MFNVLSTSFLAGTCLLACPMNKQTDLHQQLSLRHPELVSGSISSLLNVRVLFVGDSVVSQIFVLEKTLKL